MKRPRLTLYGQILFWFFLNLALVAAVLLVVLKVQFQMDLGAFLTGRTQQRFEAAAKVLSADLRAAPRSEWQEIVTRYEEAYRVRLVVWGEEPEPVTIGDKNSLPDRLLEAMREEYPEGMPRRALPPPRAEDPGFDRPLPPGAGFGQRANRPPRSPERRAAAEVDRPGREGPRGLPGRRDEYWF